MPEHYDILPPEEAEPSLLDSFEGADGPPPKETELTKQRRRADALDTAASEDITPAEAFVRTDEIYSTYPGEAEEIFTKQRYAEVNEGLDVALQLSLEQEPAEGLQLSDTVRSLLAGQEAVQRLSQTPHPASHEISEELRYSGTVKNAHREWAGAQIASLGEDLSLWEHSKELAGLFFLPTYIKDQSDFVNAIRGTDVFNGPEAMKEIVRSYLSQPMEIRQALFPFLQEHALEVTEGNTKKATQLLLNFLDPSRGDAVDYETTLNAVDWGLIGVPVVFKLAQVARTVNTVRRLSRLRSDKDAAKAVDAALSDRSGTVAKEMDRSAVESALDALPFNNSHIIPETVDDLAGAVGDNARLLEEELQSVRKFTDQVSSDNFLELKVLTKDEMTDFRLKRKRNLHEWARDFYKERGYIVDRTSVVESTDDGFKLRFEMYDSKTGTRSAVDTPTLSYTADGQKIENANLKGNSFTSYVFSPTVWLESALKEGLVAESTLINFQQHRLAKILGKANVEAWKGTSKAEQKRISAVLDAGANQPVHRVDGTVEVGKVYSWRELDEGVEIRPGEVLKLSDKEKLSYFKVRQLFDSNWQILNKIQRETLSVNGFQEARFGGKDRILKPFLTPEEVPGNAFNSKGVAHAHDPIQGNVVSLTKAELQDRYRRGWVMTKLHDSSYVMTEGKGAISWALVPVGRIKSLRTNPIKYVRGYVPRIYKESPYVLSRTVNMTVDGSTTSKTEPIHLFSGRKEAQEWVERNIDPSERGQLTIAHRNEVAEPTYRELVTQEAGGLFVDDRGRHLLFGLDNEKAKVWSAQEALDRQLNYIASRVPMNQWRISVVERWMKAAKAAGAQPEEIQRAGFHARLDGIANPKVRAALESSQRWIRDQLLMRTWEEKRWDRMMVAYADWAEGKTGLGLTRQLALNVADKDPFSWVRAASFHALLGFWNPAQLIVQAQGFSVAAALDGLNPIQVARRIQQYSALRLVVHSAVDHPEVWARAAKVSGRSKKDFENMVNEVRLSGIMDSVATNADLEAMKYGLGADGGAIAKILSSNLMIYREGETFTRGYAFMVARDVYRKKNGIPFDQALTKDQLIEVTELATQKMLNLNRANRAQWQKGALSVPFQFFQVTAKFMEDVLLPFRKGKDTPFTGAQRMKIAGGQIALYGAAGFPAGTYLLESALSAFGVGPEDLTEETKAGLRDGVAGFLTEMAFDEGISIGKRGAYLSGAEEMAKRILRDGLSLQVITGAGGHVFGGALDSLLFNVAPLVFNPELEVTEKELKRAFFSMTDVIGTFSNFHKAYVWNELQAITDRQGRIVADEDDIGVDDITMISIYKALGFSSQTVEDVYETAAFNRNVNTVKKEAKTNLKTIIRDYLGPAGRNENSEADMRNMEVRIRTALMFYPEPLAMEIYRETWEDIFSEEERQSRLDRETRRAWENMMDYGLTSSPFGGAGLTLRKTMINEVD